MPTRERGRPARTTLAQPGPSPRPGSTGKDARALLGPGPCRSRRQGGRVRYRRETERQPKGEDAGGPLSSRLPFKGESAQTNWLVGRLESRFDNALVALRRSSWPFVDNSFSFVSGQSGHPALACSRNPRLTTLHSSLSTQSEHPCFTLLDPSRRARRRRLLRNRSSRGLGQGTIARRPRGESGRPGRETPRPRRPACWPLSWSRHR